MRRQSTAGTQKMLGLPTPTQQSHPVQPRDIRLRPLAENFVGQRGVAERPSTAAH